MSLQQTLPHAPSGARPALPDFGRADETDDAHFYARPRLVSHLDAKALATVEHVIGQLAGQAAPAILDLMASWDSHLPGDLAPSRVVGLGLNLAELQANPRLDQCLVQDLNQDPALPFPDQSFDLVLNTVSVDYLVDPVAVFREAGRVLKPGGLLAVIFSNRWFEPKVTNIWRKAGESERPILVEQWLAQTGLFQSPRLFLSKGQPRPAHDKHAHLGLPSDPVYAVYAERRGGAAGRPPRVVGDPDRPALPGAEELAPRLAQVGQTLRCPYCGERLSKWAVPQTPFTEWDNEYMHVCMHDQCPYLLAGWSAMSRQGNHGVSYRFMYNPANGSTLPIPILSLKALKDGIID